MPKLSKETKPLEMGEIQLTRMGKVYGPGRVEVSVDLFDSMQERVDYLQKKRAPQMTAAQQAEIDRLALETEEDTFDPDASFSENDEIEIPTFEELSKQSRKHLNIRATEVGIENPESFSNRDLLAQAIIDALTDASEEEEVEDEEEEDDEE
jgi:hypothetical protein